MFGWGKRSEKLPEGWVRLYSPPFDQDGPIWTDEIELATRQFRREFRAPVLYEIEPGQCPCIYVTKAIYESPIRTYEGRATLIQRKNDEFRTSVFVTAPAARSWNAFNSKYSLSIPKGQVTGLIQLVRGLCERSHEDTLRAGLEFKDVETPANPAVNEVYAEADELRKLISSLELCYQQITEARRSDDYLILSAAYLCRLAVGIRARCGIDLCNLMLVDSPVPPQSRSPSLTKALSILDRAINEGLDQAEEGSKDKTAKLLNFLQMQAGLIWKGYLLAANAYPISWEHDAAFALSCLKVLSETNRLSVIKIVREDPHAEIRMGVNDFDWPPRGFLDLYRNNNDIIEAKLAGAIQSPIGENKIEIVKLTARRTAVRSRQSIDSRRRMDFKEILERSASTRSIDKLMSYYGEMRREDFCELVAASVGRKSFSDNDAMMPLYLREWVRTNGDRRKIFPDWFAQEGRQRIADLSQRWLTRAMKTDRQLTFSQWLVSDDAANV